jgi:hypothetical protein
MELDDINLDYHVRLSDLPWPGSERELGKLSQTHYNIHFHLTEAGNPAITRTVANRFLAP